MEKVDMEKYFKSIKPGEIINTIPEDGIQVGDRVTYKTKERMGNNMIIRQAIVIQTPFHFERGTEILKVERPSFIEIPVIQK